MKQFNEHTRQVNCVSFHPNGNYIASGSDDKSIRIWDIQQSKWIRNYTWSETPIKIVSISPHGESIACGSGDRAFCINNGSVATLPLSSHNFRSLSFSLDSTMIVCCSGEYLSVHKSLTGEGVNLISKPIYPNTTVACAAFSPDGKRIISCYSDYTIRIWENQNGVWVEIHSRISSLRKQLHLVNCLSFSPDGHCVLGFGDRLLVLTPPDLLAEKEFIEKSRMNSVSFSPNGKLIASGSEDGTIRIWDYHNEECVMALDSKCGQVNSVSFSPDGLTLASGYENGSVCIWDIE